MASVVDPGTGLLFCEGNPDSLDHLLLGRMLPGPSYMVVPTGGKYGLASFMDGYCRGRTHRGRIIGFRDRDFDREPFAEQPALIRWSGSSKEIYLSYRACVESYLLEPALILRFWSLGPVRERRGEPWALEVIEQWIVDAAHDIADYQAVRWALAALRPADGWPQVRDKLTGRSGALPSSLAFEQCLEQAQGLVRTYQVQSGEVTAARLCERAEAYRQRFASDEFWSGHGYRIWFHGKDLQKAMQRKYPDGLPLKPYFEWAAEQLDYTAFPDLRELANKLAATR